MLGARCCEVLWLRDVAAARSSCELREVLNHNTITIIKYKYMNYSLTSLLLHLLTCLLFALSPHPSRIQYPSTLI